MKKFLLLCALLATTLVFNEVYAQNCSITSISTSNISKQQIGNDCYVKFNLTMIAQLNGGNKQIWFHFWNAANYPTTQWNYANVPTSTFLSSSIGTLGINNAVAPAALITTWPSVYDNTQPVTMATADAPSITTDANGATVVVLTNLTLKITNNNCNIPAINFDAWAANSTPSNGSKPGCNFKKQNLNVGDLSLSLSHPIKNCGTSATGRAISFTISTNSPTPIDVAYQIRKDDNVLVNNLEVYNPNTDVNVTTGGTLTATIDVNTPFVANNIQSFTGYNTAGESSNYWIAVSYTPSGGTPYSLADITSNACAALPVSFKSFNANRNKQNVSLKWETASEENNRGFNVQRKLPNGDWQTIAFVFSAAQSGNSSSVLSYSYNDLNTAKGVSQYRLQQVDMDNRAKYSEIRSVRSEEMPSKLLVFPNPSVDGKVNVVFDDATSVRDVIVSDVAGRIIKKYNGVNGSSLVIDNLNEGFYSIQVTDRTTSTMSVEKVVIKKR